MDQQWPFGDLPMFGFDVIVADPPWAFENYSVKGEKKNAKAQYACMPTSDICALPVGHLAAGDCWLWMWATHPMLKDALQVVEAWGFSFVTSGIWVKRGRDTATTKGKLAFGTGYVLRSASEPFIIAKAGAPPSFSKSERTVIEAPRRQHSRKPEESYKACERLFGKNARRLDLFSRQQRKGWSSWGNEADKFEEIA